MKLKTKVRKVKRKVNPWLEHVKKVRAKNKGLKFSAVLVKAKKTYVKIK